MLRRTAIAVLALTAAAVAAQEALPPVPQPEGNDATEAKRALGKMLFFEEQLSSDDSVSCATCHVMTRGGTDPRRARNPGSNGVFGDLGDVMGSPGVAAMDADGRYRPADGFGAAVQATPRTAPTPFAAIWEDQILWDGRAGTTFSDPDTGDVLIASGGALENQALLPLTNPVEMGHADRDLAQVASKLAAARPLALAADVPADLAQALGGEPDYPELFRRAFGDGAITASRIAMAIASYERTLVPDRTKYDRYAAGDLTALTPQELRGLDALTTSKCTTCHVAPLFTDGTFRATGVRAPSEDPARAKTTNYSADRGKFKVPTLRNVALKTSFFHDGQRTELGQAIDFYSVNGAPAVGGMRQYGSPSGHPSGLPSNQFVDNQDPVLATITVTPANASDIAAFLRDALVDPRVAAGAFPFDAPTLASQRGALQPIVHGAGHSGDAAPPQAAVHTPAFAGSDRFTVSVTGGRPGAAARLVSWEEPTADGAVAVSDPIALRSADGVPYGNVTVPLTDARPGTRLQFAWQVDDPDAPGGVSVSPTVSVVVFKQRPQFEGGAAVPSPEVSTVDDGDAYVESARLAVAYGRAADAPARDAFSLLAWLAPAAAGADASSGTVSLTVGGVGLVSDAAIDARGRFAAPGASGSFDPATGRLQVAVRGVDLRRAIVSPHSVPVRIEVAGLGLAHPAVATTLPFDARENLSGRTAGRYAYRASGTGNGAFHVTSAAAQTQEDGRVRVRITAALDSPGRNASWAPGSLTLTVGGTGGFRTTQNALGYSAAGTSYGATPGGDLLKLRIDVLRRTLVFDVLGAFPELAAAAPGSRVDVPVTFSTRPSGTETTIVSSTTARVAVGRAKR